MPSGPEPPWVLPYLEEPGGNYHDASVLRPSVPVCLGDDLEGLTPKFAALIDSGSERTLAGPGLGRFARAEAHPASERTVGIGGRQRRVRFAPTRIRLYQSGGAEADEPVADWIADVGYFTEWEPPWAAVLGQRGFFDQFTVTMSRFAQAIAIEPREAFDHRFGYLYAE